MTSRPEAIRQLAGLTGAALRSRDYTDDMLNELRVAFTGQVMRGRTRFVMPAPPDR